MELRPKEENVAQKSNQAFIPNLQMSFRGFNNIPQVIISSKTRFNRDEGIYNLDINGLKYIC